MTVGQPFPEPVEVRHEKGARRVAITWQDGHVSTYGIDDLRSWCPCAVCQGHGGTTKHLGLVGQTLARVEVVGNYALCFGWGDGHETGIYTFRYLRALCSCESCEGEHR